MTRKDYIKFAAMLEKELEFIGGATQTWCRIVRQTADIFAADNPNFNRDKFYEACGYYED